MFINWAHFLIPKIFFVLSFIANPLFVYLISTESSFPFGNYRFLLYFFAIFNVLSSVVDVVAPICVYTFRYATVVFLTDGPFEERSRIGDFLIAARCAFISGTYGILNAHFLYRFMSLRYNHIILEYFNPYGLIISVYWVLIHWTLWVIVNDTLMTSDPELREYVRIEFEQYYNVHIEDVNIKIVVFSEVSDNLVYRSWIGTIFETLLASYSINLYIILGYKIMSRLNKGLSTMSNKTLQIQRRLFWALFIQTAIPICVSFTPCSVSLYSSAFRVDFMSHFNWVASVAVSTFSVLDPLAVIFCLPALRNRFFLIFGIDLKSGSTNQIPSIISL